MPDSRPWLSKQEALEAVADMAVVRPLPNGKSASLIQHLNEAGCAPRFIVVRPLPLPFLHSCG